MHPQINMVDGAMIAGEKFRGKLDHCIQLYKQRVGQLRQYLRRVVAVTPQADFRNIAMAKNPDIPYDLKAVYLDEEGWQGIAPADTDHGGTRL